MSVVRMFSWGFWGWGEATQQLLKTVESVERQRGFRPPLFVDIRLKRAGRATGFKGATFEKQAGRAHYIWMPKLGNKNLRTGKRNAIKDPAAVDALLQLAIDARRQRRRVIFFCACPSPDGLKRCHRRDVSKLLMDAASSRGVRTVIEEWPGGTPARPPISLRVSPDELNRVTRGAKSVRLPFKRVPPRFLGLPWGSIVLLGAATQELPISVGPAAFRGGEWVIPRFGDIPANPSLTVVRQIASDSRNALPLQC